MDLIRAYRLFDANLRNLEDLRTKIRGGAYYFGEYLSQVLLKLKTNAKSFQRRQLSTKGDFLSGLSGECLVGRTRWFISVRLFTSEITEAELQATISISQLFESGWRLPIAANFIALLPRRKTDVAILQAFRAAPFTGSPLLPVA